MGSVTSHPASADRHPLCDSEDLAGEVALGYFDDDAICLKFGIDADTLLAIGRDTGFRRLVLDAMRRQDEGGEAFRMEARRRMEGMLDVLEDIARDDKAGKATRIQAATAIGKYAGHEGSREDGAGVTLQIRTNLAVGKPDAGDGSYTLTARPDSDTGGDLIE